MAQRPPPPPRGGPPQRPVPPPPPYLAGGPDPSAAPTVPHRLPRPRRAVPVGALLALALVLFVLVTKPEVVVQTVTTPLALLIVAGIVVGVVLLGLLLGRFLPRPAVTAVLVVVWLVLGYLLVWPFYADDLFPQEVSRAAPPPAAVPAAPPAGGAAAAPAAVPVGPFRGLGGHRGSGEASVIPVAGGSSVVRLSGVDIGSGPDLRLYLVPGADRDSPDGDVVDLGRFGTGSSGRGDYNHPLPPGVTVRAGEPYTVLVWCRAFAVPVAGATLR